MTEKDLQRFFLKKLDLHNIYYVKIIVATVAGCPDCIACIKGKFYAIEFKSSKGRMSAIQIYKRDKILKSCGNYLLVTPENYEEKLTEILEY